MPWNAISRKKLRLSSRISSPRALRMRSSNGRSNAMNLTKRMLPRTSLTRLTRRSRVLMRRSCVVVNALDA